jgi:hypothetical protein
VHLRVDRDRALVFGAGALQITQAEALALVEALNLHFQQDGMRFAAATPARWYVRFDQAPAVVTSPLHLAIGQDVRDCMPTGAGALDWHRVQNEIQMLLYQHAVNDAREQNGAATINSVWLWGEGELVSTPASPWPKVQTDDAVVAGLAQASKVEWSTLPGQFTAVSDATLVWLDALTPYAAYGDLDGWRRALERMECQWFTPIWEAWRNGDVTSVELCLPGQKEMQIVRLGPGSRWQFWRRPASTLKLQA